MLLDNISVRIPPFFGHDVACTIQTCTVTTVTTTKIPANIDWFITSGILDGQRSHRSHLDDSRRLGITPPAHEMDKLENARLLAFLLTVATWSTCDVHAWAGSYRERRSLFLLQRHINNRRAVVHWRVLYRRANKKW